MKYNLAKSINIFKRAGFLALEIENTNLLITDSGQTAFAGKTSKKGETIELDGIIIHRDVILFVEYTNTRNLDTDDFDNFIRKITFLENKDKLKNAIDKIWQKYKPENEDKPNYNNALVLGLYITPFQAENQEATLRERIVTSERGKIFLWGRDTLEYFMAISSIMRSYSKYEIYSYFSLKPELIFNKKELERQTSYISSPYIEIESGVFNCRMIIYKSKPDTLLRRAYVLRNEGWKSDSFQRMIIPEKIRKIRDYIINNKDATFANNIIVSLDPSVNSEDLKVMSDRGILLPNRFGTLCIIDGQHRLLAFTQDFYSQTSNTEKINDAHIRKMSEEEELIVTLLIFKGSPEEILRKQTQLFRDINATQTKVKSDFIYNLEEIINPMSPEAIGNSILKHLSKKENGIFSEKFSVKWYQGGRIKRSSVVKWGLAELVNIQNDFLYSQVTNGIKKKYQNEDVSGYVVACSEILEKYFVALRKVFEGKNRKKDIWDFPSNNGMMFLSTSAIVGFLRLLRHFLYSKIKSKDYEKYLREINVNFDKKNYQFTSSQWAKLEEAMFDDIRRKYKNFGDESLIKR